MNNIIKSLSVIVGIATVASLATLAYFTDQDKSSGNVLGASTVGVDLELGGDGGSNSAYFNIPNMTPGDKIEKCLVIKNPSASIDALVRMYLRETANDYYPIKEKITIQAYLNPADGCTTQQASLLNQGYTVYKPAGINDQIIFKTKRMLKDFIGSNNAIDTFGAQINGTEEKYPILSGQAAVYKIVVEFDKSADNNFKGKSWTGDLIVDSVQSKSVTSRNELGWTVPNNQ